MNQSAPDIAARYARAAAALPIHVLPRRPGVAPEVYWLDDRQIFFMAERWDEAADCIVETPAIADLDTGEVREVMARETIAALIAARSGAPPSDALANAQFDMPAAGRLTVTIGGRGYQIDTARGEIVAEESLPETPALYAPDGAHAVLLDGDNLVLHDRRTGACRPLTHDGVPLNAYGRQPEDGPATLSYRQRPSPVGVWSADSRWFLTHRIDERGVPTLPLVQHSPPGGVLPVLYVHPWAAPGDPLPLHCLVALRIDDGAMVGSALEPMTDFPPILTRSAWFSGPEQICRVRIDRFHRHVELVELDLQTGDERVIAEERVDKGYVELHPIIAAQPNVRALPNTDEVLWWSQRDGWGHLYLLDARTGAVKSQVTKGAWQVRDIVHLDAERRRILFTAGGIDPEADPGLRRLCAANLDGSGFVELLEHDGDVAVRAHPNARTNPERPYRPSVSAVGAAPDGRAVVARLTHVTRGERTVALDLDTGRSLTLAEATPDSAPTPRPIEVLAADDKTPLHGLLFTPSDFREDSVYPLLDLIYPGPQTAFLPRSFGARTAAIAQAFAELGCVVMVLDSRGVPFRSRDIRQAGYGSHLEPQLSDHAEVVRQLRKRHAFLDPNRAGIIGVSAGGAAAARALFDYGEVFKVGVSVCGSHDGRGYLSVWTDQFIGPLDADQGEARAAASAAHRLRGDLMLVSGDMDENVHLAQTLGLADALIRANKDFELLVAPNEGHLVMLTNGWVQRRIWDFLVRRLIGETPPTAWPLAFDPIRLAEAGRRAAREGLAS